MQGVLILAHGSRRVETETILNSLVKKVREKTGGTPVESAYLQFSEQNLEAGTEQLFKKGATSIRVIPMFIFDGIHVTQDIPEELERLAVKYPGISISMSRHLGDDDRIADIIVDRIHE